MQPWLKIRRKGVWPNQAELTPKGRRGATNKKEDTPMKTLMGGEDTDEQWPAAPRLGGGQGRERRSCPEKSIFE